MLITLQIHDIMYEEHNVIYMRIIVTETYLITHLIDGNCVVVVWKLFGVYLKVEK